MGRAAWENPLTVLFRFRGGRREETALPRSNLPSWQKAARLLTATLQVSGEEGKPFLDGALIAVAKKMSESLHFKMTSVH